MLPMIRALSVTSGMAMFLFPIPSLSQFADHINANDWGVITGVWEHEWSVDTKSEDSSNLSSAKFESVIETEWKHQLYNADFTGIVRIRADGQDNLGESKVNATLRELYADLAWANSYWRIGKQQIVWGQADGLKVLDIVNPQDFREFILDEFDQSRIPLWSINTEIVFDNDNVITFIWIPNLEFDDFPDSGDRFEFSSSLIVPQPPANVPVTIVPFDEPDSDIKNHEVGLRFAAFYNGWDITLNYLYHWHDQPVIFSSVEGVGILITPEYKRNQLIGGTLSNVFGSLTVRSEIGFNTHTYHLSSDLNNQGISESEELASVLGFDWQGISDTLISFQWFQSHLFEEDVARLRGTAVQTLTLLYRRTFANETWTFEVLALHSLTNDDSLARPKLSYQLHSNFELWLSADVFSGGSDGLFGQFDQDDQFTMGLRYGFL